MIANEPEGYSWGASFRRTWEVEGDDRLCLTGEHVSGCYALEKSTTDADLYRVRELATGKLYEFRVTDERAVTTERTAPAGSEGGAAAASAAEIAAELSNPNTALGTRESAKEASRPSDV